MTALIQNVIEDSPTLALTLEQRLADGPIPLPKALRYAIMLGEEVRLIHDSGRTYGALMPSNIAITPTGLELIHAPRPLGTITPYTAPELLQGQPPDARSDIFAFGAIVYELVTGLHAFAGDNADELAEALSLSTLPPSGSPGIDQLVAKCIVRDPEVRCQRMQKAVLELKIIAFSAPRNHALTLQRRLMSTLRAETDQLEARMATLLQTYQKAVIEMQQEAGEAIAELRGRQSNTESAVAEGQARQALVEQSTEDFSKRITTHIEQNVEAIDEHMTELKEGIDVLSQTVTVGQESVGARLHEIEANLKSHRTAIVSVVAGQEQTDDMVEGVVAAMELLQSNVFDREEEYD